MDCDKPKIRDNLDIEYTAMEEFLQNSYHEESLPRTSTPTSKSLRKRTSKGKAMQETQFLGQKKSKKNVSFKVKIIKQKGKSLQKHNQQPPPSGFGTPLTSKSQPVFQLRIILQDIQPPIWRRIQVIANTTFKTLHKYIQQAMGWSSRQPYKFFASSSPNFQVRVTSKLSSYLFKKGDKISYRYDFEDKWDHLVMLEEVLPLVGKKSNYPKMIDGRRACPPESCGGSCGYKLLMEVFSDPQHPKYRELIIECLREMYPKWHPERFLKRNIFKAIHVQN